MDRPDLAAFDRDALLRSGAVVHIAPARPGDEQPIADFYRRLDDVSTYNRFFGIRREIPFTELHELTAAPATRCVAILAWIGGAVVAVGEFHATRDRADAEVAFAVDAAHQHDGIATLLLEDLAVIAAYLGFRRLTAVTLPTNVAMQLVFRTVGLSEQHRVGNGETSYALDLTTLEGLRAGSASRCAPVLPATNSNPSRIGPSVADLLPLR